MPALAVDLGGTKLSLAVFSKQGAILYKQTCLVEKRDGNQVGDLLTGEIQKILAVYSDIQSVGIAVPGIYHHKTGTVWAPNIKGWDDYPLLRQLQQALTIPVTIDSDGPVIFWVNRGRETQGDAAMPFTWQ
jgi:glucokinase